MREKEGAVQRPEANQGGREEEEKGLRISLREPERLHGTKTEGWRKHLAHVIGPMTPIWSPAGKKGSGMQAWARVESSDMSF